jgi:hypothetical protein
VQGREVLDVARIGAPHVTTGSSVLLALVLPPLKAR